MELVLKPGLSGFWPVFHASADDVRRKPASRSIAARGGSAEVKWLRDLQRARARRGEFMNPRLFADPAWDMLIELYACELAQRRTTVTDLTVASGVPQTTALRWISALQKDGLVVRRNDPLDGRRIFISLTEKGSNALRQFFDSLPPSIFPFEG